MTDPDPNMAIGGEASLSKKSTVQVLMHALKIF
jgi:hypothetical protein